MEDGAQDMEDKEENPTTSRRAKVLAIRQNLSRPREIHRSQGTGSMFDFAFASGDSTFSDCLLKLYIEESPEEGGDVDPRSRETGEAPDFTEQSMQCSSSQNFSLIVGHSRGMLSLTV